MPGVLVVIVTPDRSWAWPRSSMIPTPSLRLPNLGEPRYSSVAHDVEGSLSKLSGTSLSFSGWPPPSGSWTSALTMAAGAAPAAGALLDPAALEEVPDGVEPGTSSTEPATESRFVPTPQASAITTARASTEMPTTATRRRAPGSSVSATSVLPVPAYSSSRSPPSVQPSPCRTASRSSEVRVHGSPGAASSINAATGSAAVRPARVGAAGAGGKLSGSTHTGASTLTVGADGGTAPAAG